MSVICMQSIQHQYIYTCSRLSYLHVDKYAGTHVMYAVAYINYQGSTHNHPLCVIFFCLSFPCCQYTHKVTYTVYIQQSTSLHAGKKIHFTLVSQIYVKQNVQFPPILLSLVLNNFLFLSVRERGMDPLSIVLLYNFLCFGESERWSAWQQILLPALSRYQSIKPECLSPTSKTVREAETWSDTSIYRYMANTTHLQ